MPKTLIQTQLSLMLLVLLTACGVKVGAIHSVDADRPVAADMGSVVGKIQFIVDGKLLKYNLLNRPLMRLFRFPDSHYYESPMVNADGTFAWALPEGGYEIAVLFGGMSPVGQPIYMRDTDVFWRVNGFTYPGYRFSVGPGEVHYLGTLTVDVTSRKMNAIIDFTGERVFDSLNNMQVTDESATDSMWQALKSRPGAGIGLFERFTFLPESTQP